jgi:hypothetical protein
MIARRLIEISTPRGADEPLIPLRLLTRPGHPPVLVTPFAAVFGLFWLSPIVQESPAPMPMRDFRHSARIFAESTAVGRS